MVQVEAGGIEVGEDVHILLEVVDLVGDGKNTCYYRVKRRGVEQPPR